MESRRIRIKTNGNSDVIDITGHVAREIDNSSVGNGIATLFAVGSTAGIATIEHESGLIADFKRSWDRLVPASGEYEHDRAWGDGNGHSHVRASILGACLTVPFTEKRMLLGRWQQIVYVDFDNRPRSREIVVQLIGE